MNKYIIGLDIGGSKIEGVVFDGDKAVKKQTIATPRTLAGFKDGLLKLTAALATGRKIAGLGIGSAGIVDPKKAVLVTSPNIKYIDHFGFISLFKGRDVGRILLDNDANCFARAEWLRGKGKGHKNILALVLGTGIGSGMVINGQIYRGSHYSGGEIGQMMLGDKTLEKHYQNYKRGDNLKCIAEILAVRLADLVNTLDPECIVIGGKFGQIYEKRFLPQTIKLMDRYVANKQLPLKIYVSRMESAGSIGAALMFNS